MNPKCNHKSPHKREAEGYTERGMYTIARTWKQPRYPLTDEWIKKLWYIWTITQP